MCVYKSVCVYIYICIFRWLLHMGFHMISRPAGLQGGVAREAPGAQAPHPFSFGLSVWGLGFRVWGLGFRVWGLGFGV